MKNYASVIMAHMRHDAPEGKDLAPIEHARNRACLSGKEKIYSYDHGSIEA